MGLAISPVSFSPRQALSVSAKQGENYEDSSANCDLGRCVFDRIVISISASATARYPSNRPESRAGANLDDDREIAINIRAG
jgi:hypothetical protein